MKINYQLLIFFCFNVVADSISWTLLNKPAIFGNKVSLKCHLTSASLCCDSFARKWSAGKTFDLIILNGVSSNKTKYTEIVEHKYNISTLIITDFNEKDVNIPYECTYGFETFSKILELTPANFEFHPVEQIPVEIDVDENHSAVSNITFKTIYPAPVCSALEDVNNISSKLFVKTDKKGMFFTSNILLVYDVSNSCYSSRIILVQCIIGRTTLTIVNSTISCSQAPPTGLIWKPLLLSVVVCLSVILIATTLIYYYRIKWKCLKYCRHTTEQKESNIAMINRVPGTE
ncbi:uncharacterized protein LOC127717960 isoform X1 [Mytilus californianus]|uniref:uncharacterized protein LOC127717960 isoform X1 n=1 Tax=Mytilus californianus TaxID=6549 RepID=UPI0022456F68|nr:uncharacterized protein LOC127717960 isoform X1 [Mytilus californianus]